MELNVNLENPVEPENPTQNVRIRPTVGEEFTIELNNGEKNKTILDLKSQVCKKLKLGLNDVNLLDSNNSVLDDTFHLNGIHTVTLVPNIVTGIQVKILEFVLIF